VDQGEQARRVFRCTRVPPQDIISPPETGIFTVFVNLCAGSKSMDHRQFRSIPTLFLSIPLTLHCSCAADAVGLRHKSLLDSKHSVASLAHPT
jgi:hypothetical protein